VRAVVVSRDQLRVIGATHDEACCERAAANHWLDDRIAVLEQDAADLGQGCHGVDDLCELVSRLTRAR